MSIEIDSNRRVRADLDVKASVGIGDALDTRNWRELWVQVDGTFVATLAIEVSLDGGTFQEIVTVDAGSLIELTGDASAIPAAAVRIRTSTYTSGTPTAVLIGRSL